VWTASSFNGHIRSKGPKISVSDFRELVLDGLEEISGDCKPVGAGCEREERYEEREVGQQLRIRGNTTR